MKEVSEKYLKEIYLNVLKAIIVVLYFFVLNLAYENIKIEYLELGIKILTMIFLFISIYIFEKAYKKDDEKLALQGIEILVLATYTLTTEYITTKYNYNFTSYSLVASYIFAIYFILKSIVVYTKGRKELAEELSDIREIVKKDEPVIKEATRKNKEDKEKNISNKENQKNKENKKDKIKTNTKKKKLTTTGKSNATTKNTISKKKNTNTSKTNKTNEKATSTVKKKKEEVKEND